MHSAGPGIAVVILNWNDAEATIRCAESVLRAIEEAGPSLTDSMVYVVDNGSESKHVRRLQSWRSTGIVKRVSLIRNETNLGYAAGMNAGIRTALAAGCDYLWLLNNDLTVDPASIRSLLEFSAANKDAMIVGSTVFDPATRRVRAAGGYRYYPSIAYMRPLLAGTRLDRLPKDLRLRLDYVDGCAVWVSADFIRRIGGLPESHFLYFEELEIARLLEQGESLDWCPRSLVGHRGGGSASTPELQARATYHAAISAFRYTRNYHPWWLPTVVLARVFGIAIRAGRRLQPALLWAVFAAVGDFIRGDSR